MMGFELGTYEIKAHWFNAYRINKNWEKKSIMFMTSVINFRRINKSGAVLIKVLAEMQKYLNNSWVKSVREVTANLFLQVVKLVTNKLVLKNTKYGINWCQIWHKWLKKIMSDMNNNPIVPWIEYSQKTQPQHINNILAQYCIIAGVMKIHLETYN